MDDLLQQTLYKNITNKLITNGKQRIATFHSCSLLLINNKKANK